jgi:RNA polymerase sigma-70 factor (ECF subfamily)
MEHTLSTKPSLLLRIRDPMDNGAWQRFVGIYTPFIYNVCRKRGLQSADAADVAQDVMRRVAQAISKFEYDPGVGAFRSWLFSVTRNSLNDFLRKQRRAPSGSGQTTVHALLDEQPDPAPGDRDDWRDSWRQHLLDWAIERVRHQFEPETWKAFWATSVEDRPVEQVARELKRSSGAVYIARSRVMARLRKLVEEVDDSAVE